MSDNAPLPIGWFGLVDDLRDVLRRDYPSVILTEMTADRGWLHVRYDDRTQDPAARLRLDRVVQAHVTQSLHTCMACGSGHGRDRGDRRVVTCDSCDREIW